jgi:hypothetical protein
MQAPIQPKATEMMSALFSARNWKLLSVASAMKKV